MLWMALMFTPGLFSLPTEVFHSNLKKNADIITLLAEIFDLIIYLFFSFGEEEGIRDVSIAC